MKKKSLEFDKDSFGQKVKVLRLKYQMTQEDVADYLKVTRGAYGGCENASFRPSVDILMGLRELYLEKGEKAVSMDWLFGYTEIQEGFVYKIDQSKEITALKEKIRSLEELLEAKNELLEFHKSKKK